MGSQDGWRWCRRCQVLAYSGFSDGICYDGEPHDLGDSAPYIVSIDETPPGAQEGWRWCGRCQVMVFNGHGDGICWDGEPHDLSGSSQYSLPLDEAPPGAQEGWRWCSRCQSLAYGGFGDGVCWDGRRHYLDDSGPYCIAFEQELHHPPLPPVTGSPPPPPPPTVAVGETGHSITVNGGAFTPNGPVLVSFVRGADVKKIRLTAGPDGRIQHIEPQLDPERVGGAVIARDETTGQWTAARTYRSFPLFRPIVLADPVLVPADQG